MKAKVCMPLLKILVLSFWSLGSSVGDKLIHTRRVKTGK